MAESIDYYMDAVERATIIEALEIAFDHAQMMAAQCRKDKMQAHAAMWTVAASRFATVKAAFD